MDEERKRRNRRKKWKDWLGSWLMILPALCFLLVFTIYPMLNIVRLSFFKGNALKPLKQFVGLDNYRQLFFVKKDFLTALKNTGYYTMMVVVILLTLALLFALWWRADRMDDAGEWKIMLKGCAAYVSVLPDRDDDVFGHRNLELLLLAAGHDEQR